MQQGYFSDTVCLFEEVTAGSIQALDMLLEHGSHKVKQERGHRLRIQAEKMLELLSLTAISLSANDKEQSSLVLREKDNLQTLECIQLSVFSYSVCTHLMFILVDPS